MDKKEPCCINDDSTVSFSREESILRAIELAQASVNGAPEKPLNRPEINPLKIIAWNLLWMAVLVGIYFALSLLPVGIGTVILLTVLAALLISAINSKRIIITLVRIYQRYAPASLRRACVFEPTCSQYMIMAVEKYGVFKGVAKGINRLSRCHDPNGGEDYP